MMEARLTKGFAAAPHEMTQDLAAGNKALLENAGPILMDISRIPALQAAAESSHDTVAAAQPVVVISALPTAIRPAGPKETGPSDTNEYN